MRIFSHLLRHHYLKKNCIFCIKATQHNLYISFFKRKLTYLNLKIKCQLQSNWFFHFFSFIYSMRNQLFMDIYFLRASILKTTTRSKLGTPRIDSTLKTLTSKLTLRVETRPSASLPSSTQVKSASFLTSSCSALSSMNSSQTERSLSLM